jgi:adenylate kinase family enzyme
VQRCVILGPGAAGKSTFAAGLAAATGIPHVELDQHFWSADLEPLAPRAWIAVQTELAAADAWIMDGDLGPYDVLEPRLRRADTVVVLDLPPWLCAWRALHRSRQRLDFWLWLLTWRRRYRPRLLRAVTKHGGGVRIYVVRSQSQADRLRVDLAASVSR